MNFLRFKKTLTFLNFALFYLKVLRGFFSLSSHCK